MIVKKNIIHVAFFASLLVVTIFGLRQCAYYQQGMPMHPADAKLEELFRNHEAEFNELIIMAETDSKVTRIAPDFTLLDGNAKYPRPESELGFSRERWDEYRLRFSKLGITSGLVRYHDTETVLLIVSSKGLTTGGSSKGYAHSTNALTPQYDSLDDFRPTPPYERPVYKKLTENWYLFYDFE